ncbi:MAG: aminoacyl-tRNA hydrolase [Corynebacterium sp.]|nr:aminoacyl-tRNA hydrolase [Corynebacterium sp.]
MSPLEQLRHVLAQRLPDNEDPANPDSVQAMQLVLHLPNQVVATRADYLAAAGQAVVDVCLDERAITDPIFQEGLLAWYNHRIRKVARRARNSSWEHVQVLPGATATVGAAQVRAFVPTAVYQVPQLIKKMQIKGTDLPPDDGLPEPDPQRGLVLVNKGLGMSLGKAAAQVGHATMLHVARHEVDLDAGWEVREVEAQVFERYLPQAAEFVRDAGFTEVAPNSVTVAAFAKRPW